MRVTRIAFHYSIIYDVLPFLVPMRGDTHRGSLTTDTNQGEVKTPALLDLMLSYKLSITIHDSFDILYWLEEKKEHYGQRRTLDTTVSGPQLTTNFW